MTETCETCSVHDRVSSLEESVNELKDNAKELKEDVKCLLEVFQSAKGALVFIKWVAAIVSFGLGAAYYIKTISK